MSDCDKGGRCPVCNGRSSIIDEDREEVNNGLVALSSMSPGVT